MLNGYNLLVDLLVHTLLLEEDREDCLIIEDTQKSKLIYQADSLALLQLFIDLNYLVEV